MLQETQAPQPGLHQPDPTGHCEKAAAPQSPQALEGATCQVAETTVAQRQELNRQGAWGGLSKWGPHSPHSAQGWAGTWCWPRCRQTPSKANATIVATVTVRKEWPHLPHPCPVRGWSEGGTGPSWMLRAHATLLHPGARGSTVMPGKKNTRQHHSEVAPCCQVPQHGLKVTFPPSPKILPAT